MQNTLGFRDHIEKRVALLWDTLDHLLFFWFHFNTIPSLHSAPLFFSFHAHFSFPSPNLFSAQWKNNLTAFLGPIKSIYPVLNWSLPSDSGSVVKNPPANAGDTEDVGLTPGLGRSPGGGNDNPLQYSCLENPMEGGAW